MIDLFTVKKMSKSGGWGPVAVNLSAVKADEMVAAFIADGWAAISVKQTGQVPPMKHQEQAAKKRAEWREREARSLSAEIQRVMREDGGRY